MGQAEGTDTQDKKLIQAQRNLCENKKKKLAFC